MKKTLTVALVALAVNASAQKISNKISFPQGAKLEMITQSNAVVSMDMMGQAMETKINATFTRLFDIEKVNNGAATIEHKMKRVQMNFETPMAGSQTFDSENEADMKGEGGKMAEKALKNKYTITVDPTGKVTAVVADDDNPNKPGADGADAANPLEGMLDGIGLPKVGDATEFRILPEREVSKGESWTDTTGGIKKTYTLVDVSDTDLIISFNGEGKTERKQEANGMEISISQNDKYTGRLVIDRKTGILKQKSENIDSEGLMEMMGQSVPMKTKATRNTTITGM
jgi:hypothetical protein